MGLVATIASAVTSGWTALGDIPVAATYYARSADPTYDPATGTATGTETSVSVTVVIDDAREDALASPALTLQDRRFLMRNSQLGLTPREHDRIVVGGATYQIVRVSKDPAGVVWVLQARGAA